MSTTPSFVVWPKVSCWQYHGEAAAAACPGSGEDAALVISCEVTLKCNARRGCISCPVRNGAVIDKYRHRSYFCLPLSKARKGWIGEGCIASRYVSCFTTLFSCAQNAEYFSGLA